MGSTCETTPPCRKPKSTSVLTVVLVRAKCRETLSRFLNQVYEEEFTRRRDVGGLVSFRDVDCNFLWLIFNINIGSFQITTIEV